MDKVFSPREVDALIPKLESIFQHMDFCQKRVHALADQRPPANAHPTVAEVADSARIRSQMEFLLQAIQDHIHLISQLGGVVKDVGSGLVDFPGRFQGEDVWLCWKKGETKINFWHTLDSGYTERRPLKRAVDRSSTTH